MNTKIKNTLDSLLTKYFHANTPPNEKEACLNVFYRKCKANNINADSYKQEFEGRFTSKGHTSSSRRTSRTSHQNSSNCNRNYQHVNINSYDYQKQQEYVKVYGKFKQCIYEKGHGCIRINALFNIKGRWAVEDFVFYTGENLDYTLKKLKQYQVFTFTSNGKRYSGALNINRLWGYTIDKVEHPIY